MVDSGQKSGYNLKDIINGDALFFFEGRPAELELYEALAGELLARYPDTEIRVQKTQISFYEGRMYACVSLTPVRKKAQRPPHFITVTFGLDHPLDDSRAVAVQVRPNRYTHHVIVGMRDEIDDTLLGWIERSHALSRGT